MVQVAGHTHARTPTCPHTWLHHPVKKPVRKRCSNAAVGGGGIGWSWSWPTAAGAGAGWCMVERLRTTHQQEPRHLPPVAIERGASQLLLLLLLSLLLLLLLLLPLLLLLLLLVVVVVVRVPRRLCWLSCWHWRRCRRRHLGCYTHLAAAAAVAFGKEEPIGTDALGPHATFHAIAQ